MKTRANGLDNEGLQRFAAAGSFSLCLGDEIFWQIQGGGHGESLGAFLAVGKLEEGGDF
jgi:hypothetical protein